MASRRRRVPELGLQDLPPSSQTQRDDASGFGQVDALICRRPEWAVRVFIVQIGDSACFR